VPGNPAIGLRSRTDARFFMPQNWSSSILERAK
jgi:hypothetical protein